MTEDIRTVAWKEWRELFSRTSGRGSPLELRIVMPFVILTLVFGILLPWMMVSKAPPTGMERIMLSGMLSFFGGIYPAFLIIQAVVADVFAGERERRTLETLLATRLPDRAILMGKIAAVILYGWGASLIILLLQFVLIHFVTRLIEFSPQQIVFSLTVAGFSLLISCLTANLGTLISLRAATVKEAQQKLSFVILFVTFVPIYGPRLLPQVWRASLSHLLLSSAHLQTYLLLALLLLITNALLLGMAALRFQRSRLILD